MRSRRWAWWLFGACMAASAPAAAITLDDVVRKAHDAGTFDGVLLVGRDDAVAYRRAVGFADRLTQAPHTIGESWRWLAISGQVAAVLVMQEVERGRLDLDGRVADYLPGFGTAAVGRVTLRQLLQHTAGLANPEDGTIDEHGVPTFYRANDAALGAKAMLAPCAAPPKSAPGAKREPSPCDALVLAAILERLTGQGYAKLVATRIAKPLKLATLTLRAPSGVPTRAGVVGHSADGSREASYDVGRYGAAGALQGSAEDLWRFDRALLDHVLLSQAATDAMWSSDPKLGNAAFGAWAYAAQPKHCSAAVRIVEQRGEVGGIRTVNLIVPERRLALIAFSNTARTEWGQIAQGSGLLHDLLDAALCADDAPSAASPKRAAAPRTKR